MTNTQLKTQIDTQITNETVKSGITPTDVGENIKAVVDYVDQKVADSRPYKVYTALLTHHNGISNPSVIVLENTLGGEIIWTRSNTGRYTGTLLDIFTLNKTAFFGVIDDTKNIILGGSATSSSTIGISIIDGNTGLYTDSSFQTITIEIRVYN